MKWPFFAAVVPLLLCLSTPSVLASADQEIIDRWKARTAETVKLLQSGDYVAAQRMADGTIREMIDKLGPGDASRQWFCMVLTHKALSHAGLHQYDDALWYWHTVLTLHPNLGAADLTSFGEAGSFLKANMRPTPAEAIPVNVRGDITPPKCKKKVKPAYPRGASEFVVSGKLVVEVVIASDGRVRSPRVIQQLDAITLSYAALESVRKSTYEPGRMGGTPVDVTFTLTVNYKLN